MHRTGGSLTWQATSSPGGCACLPTRHQVASHDLAARLAGRPARRFPATGERVTQMDSELLSDTFVGLADTVVTDFDVIDFLHMLTDRSVRLLTASAAGV